MNRTNKLSNAIGNLDDRFILEALKYRSHLKVNQKFRLIGAIVASICLIIGTAVLLHTDNRMLITVYAYGSNERLADGKVMVMPGRISNSGEMQGHPLMFYVLGDEIESIRFSCKNEWISFVDWTEKRGDYGLSKNFTVAYGSQKEDYYYLVVDWVPWNIIRKLTDNQDIQISDLPQDEKEDMIVMEVTYLNGETETVAIWIRLNDNGKFEVLIDSYQITEEDGFIYQPDSLPIEHQP